MMDTFPIESMKRFIDGLRKSSPNKVWKPFIVTEKKGCDKFYKGRGENSFQKKFGIDLNKITKRSCYQIMMGDMSYASVKEANGDTSEVKAHTGDLSWVPGYEKILLVNNKTGEYLLRCYVDKSCMHNYTQYLDEEDNLFDFGKEEYKPFLKEAKAEQPEDFIRTFNIKISNIVSIGGGNL